jgi:hypothetical protein
MNGNEGQCRLCLTEGILCSSHISSEFLYDDLYDEKHRMYGVRPIVDSKNAVLQKGLREYMLCARCEQHLSTYEGYAAKVLRNFPELGTKPQGAVVRLHGIDYTKFKVFQLSLLWRAGVTRQMSFREVNLGPHEERLRRMVLNGDPGKPMDYCCLLMRTQGSEALDHIIQLPGHLRFLEHHAYDMILFGLIWIFIVSSHSTQIQEKGSFLSETGVLPIHVTRTTSEQFMAGLARRRRRVSFETAPAQGMRRTATAAPDAHPRSAARCPSSTKDIAET